jgi:DNA repair protein RadD
MKLRPFQQQAIDATALALTKVRRTIIESPTASGKSVIIAGIIARIFEKSPNSRVLVLCHQGEILVQNQLRMLSFGIKNTGIYCAQLGKKENNTQVVLASRDSLGRKPTVCGHFDFILVDEAHLVAEKEKTQYQKIFDALMPKYVIGLTGTPWRQDNGLIYGHGRFWESCAFKIEMQALFDEGFLCPYILPVQEQIIDTTGIKTTAGDFNNAQLSQASSAPEVVGRCLDAWQREASGRKVSLFFCCSRAHAAIVVDALNARRVGAVAYLDGETSQGQREQILKDAAQGRFKAIVNVGVLTTGVDIPAIDCVVFLRATKSISLFIQMAGRGLRIHHGKENVLFLDTAGNFDRFGSLEDPYAPGGKKPKIKTQWTDQQLLEMGIDPDEMKAEPPQKSCPSCKTVLPAAATSCYACGNIFFNHSDNFRTGTAGAYDVLRVTSRNAVTKKGDNAIVVTYTTQGQVFQEWLLPEKEGFHQWRARNRQKQLKAGIKKILVKPGKSTAYPEITVLA